MPENSENPVFMIHRTHKMLEDCEDKIFGEHGLTTEQYMVLMAIKYLDGPVRVTDIGLRLTRSVNSVSMIVDRMVRVGLLKRVRDKTDRRTVHVSVTKEAESLFGPATLAYQEFIQRVLSLSPGYQQTLIRLLETIQQMDKQSTTEVKQIVYFCTHCQEFQGWCDCCEPPGCSLSIEDRERLTNTYLDLICFKTMWGDVPMWQIPTRVIKRMAKKAIEEVMPHAELSFEPPRCITCEQNAMDAVYEHS